MSRRTPLLLLALFAALLLALLLWQNRGAHNPAPAASPPPLVVVTAAERLSIPVTVRAVGSVEAVEQVTVTSQVTGKVERILFEEGQRVEAGAPLVQLDSGRERAALEAARAEWRDAQRQLRRLTELRAADAVSQADLDAVRSRYQMAQARVAEIEAALAYRRILAPFSGVVGLRQVSPGGLIEPGDAITTLATVDRLKVEFRLPSDLLPRLRKGLVVQVRVPGPGRSLEGRVRRIDNRVDPATRSIALEAEIPEAEALRPGMFVSVDVVLERRDAVVVPEESIILEGGQAYLYVLRPDGTVARRRIAVGERGGGRAEVREGLAAGEQVVSGGVQKVEEGRPVRLQGEATPPGGAP